MKILGLILARSGSKGLKDKNLKTIKNFSLIEWAILSGLESKVISDIIFSTDYQINKVGGLASNFYLKRPKKLAEDQTLSYDVILYLLNELKRINYEPDLVVLLEPPCPLRNGVLIDKIINFAKIKKASAVVSLKELEDHHPIRTKKLGKTNELEDFVIKEPIRGLRRQKQEKAYIRDQAVYVLSKKNFFKHESLYGKNKYGYINNNLTVNIDNKIDYEFVKYLSKSKTFKKKLLLPISKKVSKKTIKQKSELVKRLKKC